MDVDESKITACLEIGEIGDDDHHQLLQHCQILAQQRRTGVRNDLKKKIENAHSNKWLCVCVSVFVRGCTRIYLRICHMPV